MKRSVSARRSELEKSRKRAEVLDAAIDHAYANGTILLPLMMILPNETLTVILGMSCRKWSDGRLIWAPDCAHSVSRVCRRFHDALWIEERSIILRQPIQLDLKEYVAVRDMANVSRCQGVTPTVWTPLRSVVHVVLDVFHLADLQAGTHGVVSVQGVRSEPTATSRHAKYRKQLTRSDGTVVAYKYSMRAVQLPYLYLVSATTADQRRSMTLEFPREYFEDLHTRGPIKDPVILSLIMSFGHIRCMCSHELYVIMDCVARSYYDNPTVWKEHFTWPRFSVRENEARAVVSGTDNQFLDVRNSMRFCREKQLTLLISDTTLIEKRLRNRNEEWIYAFVIDSLVESPKDIARKAWIKETTIRL
jgi:hypothetical protein